MNFHDVLLREIKVGERFRKDYGDIEALKESITRYDGCLEPILLDRDNNLLAGGRRFRAHQELNRPRIHALYIDEVDEIKAREIELEENIQRKDLEWDERVRLTEEIHKLKLARYANQTEPALPSTSHNFTGTITEDGVEGRILPIREVPVWNQTKTAELLGVDQSRVSRDLALAACLDIMPELKECDSVSDAFRRIDRRLEELEREWDMRRLKKAGHVEDRGQIIHGDCLVELEKLPDKFADCIIIDPPYGVLQPGGIGRYENLHFDDDPVAAMAHLRLVAKELQRVAKDNAHIYVFFGIKMWVETKGIFDSLGFDVDPIPLVWVKNTGSVVDWDFRYANQWEPILFISNRTRRLNQKRSGGNVFIYDSVPSSARTNIAEKPIELIKELIELSTVPGELVLDCYAGSGVVAAAAKSLGRKFWVCEKDQDQWNGINVRLAKVHSPNSTNSNVIVEEIG